MAFDINTNLDALVAIDNLGKSELSMTTCVQRLASGLRINSAKDDPAGLAIANSMAAQLSGFNQATVNINNGISYLQTADGGMSNITNLLQRMRALSVVAANGTNSTSDLVSLNSEMQQLKSEIQQIAVTTNFNGIQLLDGTVSQVQIQVGPGAGDVITVAMGQSMQLSELGSSGAGSTVTGTATVAALNAGDLTLNEVAVGASTAGGGIGQAASSATEISSAINAVTGTSGVSASAMTTLTAAAPANNATIQDFVVNDVLVSPQGAGMANLIAAINQAGIAGVSAATNKTGGWTLTSSTGENINIELSGTAANQTTAASDRAAFESATGLPDSAVGTEAVAAIPAVPGVPAQYNGQGQLIAPAIPGQPYQPPIAASYATTTGVVTLTSSNASGILIGGNAAASAGFTNGLANQAALSTTPGIANVNVLTAGAAEQAITSADNAILAVDSARAQVGAYQNRLSYQASVVQTSIENMSASLSVVRDTNFALETTNLSVAKILQQVGTAMVAHANSTPGLVLNLLR
jgi:flagellin